MPVKFVANRAVAGQKLFVLEKGLLSNKIELVMQLVTDFHLTIEMSRIRMQIIELNLWVPGAMKVL